MTNVSASKFCKRHFCRQNTFCAPHHAFAAHQRWYGADQHERLDDADDKKNDQVERRNVSTDDNSVLSNNIPIQHITASEDELTMKNYLSNEKIIKPQLEKRKYNANSKSIFRALKKTKTCKS